VIIQWSTHHPNFNIDIDNLCGPQKTIFKKKNLPSGYEEKPGTSQHCFEPNIKPIIENLFSIE
jgi:hypothetical protein